MFKKKLNSLTIAFELGIILRPNI